MNGISLTSHRTFRQQNVLRFNAPLTGTLPANAATLVAYIQRHGVVDVSERGLVLIATRLRVQVGDVWQLVADLVRIGRARIDRDGMLRLTAGFVAPLRSRDEVAGH